MTRNEREFRARKTACYEVVLVSDLLCQCSNYSSYVAGALSILYISSEYKAINQYIELIDTSSSQAIKRAGGTGSRYDI